MQACIVSASAELYPLFFQASANALQNIPSVNAMIDGDDIVYRDYCDISVAVATPKGLVCLAYSLCISMVA